MTWLAFLLIAAAFAYAGFRGNWILLVAAALFLWVAIVNLIHGT